MPIYPCAGIHPRIHPTVFIAPGTRARESWRPPAEPRGRTLTATARLASSSHPVERTQAFRLP